MAKLIIKNQYAVVPNSVINDSNISLRAKGVFAYIQSKADTWNFSAKNIAFQCKEGVDAVSAALKELEKFGYLVRTKYQKQTGYWDVEYTLYDCPECEGGLSNPVPENPSQEKPSTEKPVLENPPTKERKKREKKNNKENINIPFSDFYYAYGKKADRYKAEEKWALLTDEERQLAMNDAPVYNSLNPDKNFQKSPLVYINGKNWLDRSPEPSLSSKGIQISPEILAERERRKAHYEVHIMGFPYEAGGRIKFSTGSSIYHKEIGFYDELREEGK